MLLWTIMGVLAGAAYTASPLTILFGLWLPLLFWWAARGIEAPERRWVFGLLGAATALRVCAIAALLVTTSPAQQFNTFFSDAQFAIARSWWVRNIWLGVPIGPLHEIGLYDPYGATSYSYLLGAMQMFVGPSPYGLNFVSIAAFLAGAVTLYRIARQSFGPGAALVGFALVLFWPSTFAWSVSMLKEPMQFALTAFMVACALRAVRSRLWVARAGGALLAAATGYAMATFSAAAAAVTVAGVSAGVVAWAATRRRWVAIAGLVVLAGGGAVALSRPQVQAQLLQAARDAGDRQYGHVATSGYGYKVLDERFYSEGVLATREMRPNEAVRFVVRSVVAFFAVPLPWQVASTAGLAYLPQQFAWYALLLLGLPGSVVGFRRDALVTWILVAVVAAGVAVIAPNSGNIGTLVRHRDIVVPVLVWLSAVGVARVLAFLVKSQGGTLKSEVRIGI